MNSKACPSEYELREFLSGGLNELRFRFVELHLADCDSCVDSLNSLDSQTNLFLGEVGSNPDQDYRNEEPCKVLSDKILESSSMGTVVKGNTHGRGSRFEDGEIPEELAGYQLTEKIGQGGMGVVWKATQLSTDRIVAIKVLNTLGNDDESHIRFQREIELAASLEHPNIARVYEGGKAKSHYFYAMQFIEGCDLAEYASETRANLNQIVSLMIQICRAMEYAHQNGVIHRDLKPQNILVDTSGNPHVTDFGLAKSVDGQGELTMTGQVLGTPSYMAPEQITDPKRVSTSIDVYGLGAILYRLITGRAPFAGANPIDTLLQVTDANPQRPNSLNQQIDLDLNTICLKCLEKNPRDRYTSVPKLLEEFQRWADGEPIQARPVNWPTRVVKWSRRRPVTAATIAAFATLLIVSIGLITWKWLDADFQKSLAQTTAENLAIEEQTKTEYLYVAHMNMIQQAWNNGLPERVRELLDRHLPVADRPDLRTMEWYYYDSLCRQLMTIPTIKHGAIISAVAANPVHEMVALAGEDQQIQIWRLQPSLQRIDVLTAHAATVKHLQFSGDGNYLLSCDDQTNCIWKKQDDSFELVHQSKSTAPYRAKFSGDSKQAVIVRGTEIELFDTNTLQAANRTDHDARVTDVCFLSGGFLLSSATDGSIVLTDHESDSAEEIEKASKSVDAIAVSRDGDVIVYVSGVELFKRSLVDAAIVSKLGRLTGKPKQILAFGDDELVAVETLDDISFWNLADETFLGRIENHNDHGGTGFKVSADGELFATTGISSVAEVWNTDGLELKRKLFGHTNTIYGVDFLPGNGLITGSRDHTAKIYHSLEQTSDRRLNNGSTRLWSISFSPDSNKVAVACEDSRVVVWDTATGQQLDVIDYHNASVQFVKFSPNGKLLASAGKDNGLIRLWDVEARKTAGQLAGHDNVVNSLDFSVDGQRLVSGGNGGMVIVWDMENITELARYQSEQQADIWAVAHSRNNESVVFGGRDQRISVWNFGSGQNPELLEAMPQNITSLNFSPAGDMLASTTADGAITVFDFGTRDIKYRLIAHSGDAMFSAFSPDGETLISGGSEGSAVQFWNMRTGEPTVSLAEDGIHVHSLAIAPSGKHFATARWDGIARLWKIE